ncbi:hypothetical protein L914_05791 [Phytophthora nicotianae]|uniref:Uncharacterized protein n=2 Tax=Phytophthora nicotianae TaxID=4792 RepID=V9FGD5_PHYNI|nr:hypothetical protein F443_05967 [Phytophthora nicotianae P1569]ETL43808.1 hypothetical protein L916_05774 [Phytophthora nicotianae]ETM50122.1 hypothetical protein L914_05791 [Phytophthora nicotianae]
MITTIRSDLFMFNKRFRMYIRLQRQFEVCRSRNLRLYRKLHIPTLGIIMRPCLRTRLVRFLES